MGTSPIGDFSAGVVRTGYHCGTIYVSLTDATGYALLDVSFPFTADARPS